MSVAVSLETLAGGSVWAGAYVSFPGMAPVKLVIPAALVSATVRDADSGVVVDVFADDSLSGEPLAQPLVSDEDGRLPGFVGQPRSLRVELESDLFESRTVWVGLDPVGVVGPAGPEGPVGAAGPVGPQGSQGPQGDVGDQGVPGPAGPQGAVGSQGSQGAQGAAGPEGPAGQSFAWKGAWAGGTTYALDDAVMGSDGSAYISVQRGNMGHNPVTDTGAWWSESVIHGAVGPQGAQGVQGVAGPQGPEGPQGAQGVAGPQGAAGPAGPQGPAGPLGPIDGGSSTG